MQACANCFNFETWISNVDQNLATPGVCDFCTDHSGQTWPTSAWSTSLELLLSIYERAADEDPQSAELHIQIQEDWAIFSYSNPDDSRRFLQDVFPNEPLLVIPQPKVQLRYDKDGPLADHRASWSVFSEEIRLRNRYFPETEPDRELLKDALDGSAVIVPSGTTFYRARRTNDGRKFRIEEMGAPPPDKSTAGRANPVGIPYLYLSTDAETCVYETRVANHTYICVGKFVSTRDLNILDLANISQPDFFTDDNRIAVISVFRYLKKLGDELKKPIRSSDQTIDYIPTQYLCELAKSLQYDGVRYSSSLNSNGTNIVLFDVDAAQCQPDIDLIYIRKLTAEWG